MHVQQTTTNQPQDYTDYATSQGPRILTSLEEVINSRNPVFNSNNKNSCLSMTSSTSSSSGISIMEIEAPRCQLRKLTIRGPPRRKTSLELKVEEIQAERQLHRHIDPQVVNHADTEATFRGFAHGTNPRVPDFGFSGKAMDRAHHPTNFLKKEKVFSSDDLAYDVRPESEEDEYSYYSEEEDEDYEDYDYDSRYSQDFSLEDRYGVRAVCFGAEEEDYQSQSSSSGLPMEQGAGEDTFGWQSREDNFSERSSLLNFESDSLPDLELCAAYFKGKRGTLKVQDDFSIDAVTRPRKRRMSCCLDDASCLGSQNQENNKKGRVYRQFAGFIDPQGPRCYQHYCYCLKCDDWIVNETPEAASKYLQNCAKVMEF